MIKLKSLILESIPKPIPTGKKFTNAQLKTLRNQYKKFPNTKWFSKAVDKHLAKLDKKQLVQLSSAKISIISKLALDRVLKGDYIKEGVLTEAKISSDVARAAKKLGIKFDKKKVRTIFTNDFTGVNEPGENVKYDSWMDMDPQDYLHQGRELVKALSRKYKIYKKVPSRTGASVVFRKDKKDKKTEFTITYVKSMAGPYINYEGLKGQ